MKFVIMKIQLSEKFPFKYYFSRDQLIGVDPSIDEAAINWITATQELHAYGSTVNTQGKPAEWVSSGSIGDHCYIVVNISDPEIYKTISESPQMAKVIEMANKLFPLLGWQSLGDKIINDYDSSAPKTYEVIDRLWNT
jgi:hypothetical protein